MEETGGRFCTAVSRVKASSCFRVNLEAWCRRRRLSSFPEFVVGMVVIGIMTDGTMY